jgi:hypothetical protein
MKRRGRARAGRVACERSDTTPGQAGSEAGLGENSCAHLYFSSNYPGATYAATWIFVGLWLAVSGVNMWVGVAKAGYTVSEEFPIFLLIFAVPAIVAIFLKWRIL